MTFFRQSSKATQALASAQSGDQQKLQLILDVSTRWNSTFMTLERLCQLQAPIRQILCNAQIVKPSSAIRLELRDSHWILIQSLVEKLRPFKVSHIHIF